MFNLDGMIPKLCLLAQETGEDERARHLRYAGLQTLSAMVDHFHAILIMMMWIINAYFSCDTVILCLRDNYYISTQ